jgi:hypothetical protein
MRWIRPIRPVRHQRHNAAAEAEWMRKASRLNRTGTFFPLCLLLSDAASTGVLELQPYPNFAHEVDIKFDKVRGVVRPIESF